MRVSVSNEDSVKNALFKRLCASLSAKSVTLFDCRMTASGFSGKLTSLKIQEPNLTLIFLVVIWCFQSTTLQTKHLCLTANL